MSDTPAPALDIESLKKGLPDGPWTYGCGIASQRYYVDDASGREICILMHIEDVDEARSVARAIASIPAMIAEIERLRQERDCAEDASLRVTRALANVIAQRDSLRALNAELVGSLQAFLDYGDALVHRDRARALLAKAKAGETEC